MNPIGRNDADLDRAIAYFTENRERLGGVAADDPFDLATRPLIRPGYGAAQCPPDIEMDRRFLAGADDQIGGARPVLWPDAHGAQGSHDRHRQWRP